MRSTIDFGIDLGTTNSALAANTNGAVQVVRNQLHQELTPSVVRITPSGSLVVGQNAYNALPTDEANTHARFKRIMGSQQRLLFRRSGRTMTPVELSAEVLKALRASARQSLGEEIAAAVITAPAMFEQPQLEATSQAARLAGIEQHALLQEPIAAALAYGYQAEEFDGFILVYDLGGGTFDCSILRSFEGCFRVVRHGGDNFCGGQEIDKRFSDLILRRLRAECGLPHAELNDTSRRILEWKAEQVKIELSSVTTTLMSITDGLGKGTGLADFEAELSLSRAELEPIARPVLLKTVEVLCKTIAEASLTPRDISRVILVGGPTYMPLTRTLVAEAMGREPEFNVDPMTVVAQGAARFAAGQPLRTAATSPKTGTRIAVLRLSYDRIAQDTESAVAGRVETSNSGIAAIMLARADGGWSSGQIRLSNDAFVTQVSLARRTYNEFHLEAVNRDGSRVAVTPERFAITQGPSVEAAPLSRSLRLGLADNSTLVLVAKNTAVPLKVRSAPGRIVTAKDVHRGDATDVMRLPLLSGEREIADRNRKVGEVSLTGTALRRDLARGSEIEVEIEMTADFALSMRAYIPVLDQTIEGVCSIGTDKPNLDELQGDLEVERQRLEGLRSPEHSDAGGAASTAESLESEVEGLLPLARAGDPDAAEKMRRTIEDLRDAVDALASLEELPAATAGWNTAKGCARKVATEIGTVLDREHLERICAAGESALMSGDATGLEGATQDAYGLYWGIMFRLDATWVDLLLEMGKDERVRRDPRGDGLLKEGRLAIDRNDGASLRTIVRELWALIPDSENSSKLRYASDVQARGAGA